MDNLKRNPNTDYSLIDFCTKTKVLDCLPTGLFRIVSKIDTDKGLKPPRYELLKKKLNRYISRATILN